MLQNTLGQLRLANIATLDALTTHFTRLIELTSADEPYISALANSLAPCILRPKTDTSLTLHEKHSYRLLRDLFAHKEEIFGELKRASTLSHTPSGGAASNASRIRAISTDESNRRANMEARNRAIASKSRNSSPAPHANGRSHRRDRSSDPPTTRFPIHTSSPAVADAPSRKGAAARASLEVPGDEGTSPVADRQGKVNNISQMINNLNNTSKPTTTEKPPQPADGNPDVNTNHAEDVNGTTTFAEKRESLGRSSRFPPRKQGTGSLSRSAAGDRGSLGTGNRNSLGTESVLENGERQGVQLIDKPMDD